MKKVSFAIPVVLLFFLAGFSCNTVYQSQSIQYKTYQLTSTMPVDSPAIRLLQPYSEQINKTMNDVVGIATSSMDKKLPESTLGNFMVDAFYVMAAEKYNTKVDLAILNYGGIRLTQLPAGNVTTGKIFELMPFDNLLILQKIKGDVLQQLLDLTASKGGWPLAGVSMQIRDKKAVNVLVGGKAIDPSTVYTMVNSDFVANGGDDAAMLRNVPQITNGYLMRDALFDYIVKLRSQGKNIEGTIQNRVSNAP